MIKLCCVLLIASQIMAREPLASRIVHTDPSKYRDIMAVHEGAGHMAFSALFDEHTLETNLQFLHRGVIYPKSGIGHHFHNQCEEMFVILDGEAQFTIDGRTSVLKAPAGAICRHGSFSRNLQPYGPSGSVDEYQRDCNERHIRRL